MRLQTKMSNTQTINALIMSVTGGVTGSSTPASDFNYHDLPAHTTSHQYTWYELKETEWSLEVTPHVKSIVIYGRDKKVEWYITPDGPVVASVMEFPGVCQREFKLHNMSPDVVSFIWRSANVSWVANEMAIEDCIAVRFGKIPVVVPTGWFCKELPLPNEMEATNVISEAIIPAVLGRPLAQFEQFQCNLSQRNGIHAFSVTLTYGPTQCDKKYFTLETAHDPAAVRDIVRSIVGIAI